MTDDKKKLESRRGFLILVFIVSLTMALLCYLVGAADPASVEAFVSAFSAETSAPTVRSTAAQISTPEATAAPTSTPAPTSSPTLAPDDVIGWARKYAAQYQNDDVILTDVRLIDSEVNGQDVCFIIDLECNHSNTALQFSHLNEVMINLCKSMSQRDHFDCVSFTVFDKFVDKYGNTQRIVSITAVYKVPTLRIINYDYHMSYKYSRPTSFISCADSYYIHPGYDIK